MTRHGGMFAYWTQESSSPSAPVPAAPKRSIRDVLLDFVDGHEYFVMWLYSTACGVALWVLVFFATGGAQ